MFSTTGHLFMGLRGVEFGIQIFRHFRENCRFCILGQFPFPTILQNSGLHILKILFYSLTYLKIKHRHRFSTFQTCTNLFNQFSQLDVIAVWQPGLAVGYISVTSRSRFAGRVAPAFTESKSIHFHTRFAGRVAPAFTESKSIHFHTRFAGRVAPAFTESKSIHFHTNLSGASRNNWYYSVGYWTTGVTVPISLTFYRKFAL